MIYTNQGPGNVNRVAFSPDGKTVATTGDDGTARIWDPLTGKDLMIFKGHTDRVTGVAFSPDRKFVLTSSGRDETARLWDVTIGREVRRFTGPITSVAFSPDGKYILTGSDDGTARLWLLDLQDTIRGVCTTLTHDLTPEERAQSGISDQGPTCPVQ